MPAMAEAPNLDEVLVAVALVLVALADELLFVLLVEFVVFEDVALVVELLLPVLLVLLVELLDVAFALVELFVVEFLASVALVVALAVAFATGSTGSS